MVKCISWRQKIDTFLSTYFCLLSVIHAYVFGLLHTCECMYMHMYTQLYMHVWRPEISTEYIL